MKTVVSNSAPEPVGKYPHALRVGDFLFLSGIGPREKGSSQIPGVRLRADNTIESYDIEAQCHSVFKNVQSVLAESAATLNELVDVTVYLTNMKDDFSTYNRIWAEYFKTHAPCRTTVEVNCLPTPIAVEFKCVAYLGSKK